MKELTFVIFMSVMFSFYGNIAGAQRFNTKELKSDVTKDVIQSKLLDPSDRNFWKEGNHIPDEGFIQLAMNPNLINAKIWLLRNEIKAQRMQVIMKLVDQAHAELVRSGQMEDRYDLLKTQLKRPTLTITQSGQKNLKKLQYYFLFSPNCPHCLSMAGQLKSLPNVSPLQVPRGELRNFPGLPNSHYASTGTIQAYLPDGRVPVLVIYNPEIQRAKIIKGPRIIEQIVMESRVLLEGK